MDDGVRQTRSGEKRPVPWAGMTIFYVQRPGHGARDELKYVDTPMGLVPTRVTTEGLVNLEEIFMTWGREAWTEASGVDTHEEQHEGTGHEGVQ